MTWFHGIVFPDVLIEADDSDPPPPDPADPEPLLDREDSVGVDSPPPLTLLVLPPRRCSRFGDCDPAGVT